jgi:hypothetical protein
VRKTATRLLAQQFWLFGYDIRRPEGNLLVDLGFEKRKPPEGKRITASRYTQCLASGQTVVLWGFGMFLTDPCLGGMYLPRHAIAPRFRGSGELLLDAWDPDDVEALVFPVTVADVQRCQALLIHALSWIFDYETTVLNVCGEPYREGAIQAWKRPCCTAAAVPQTWCTAITAMERVFAV